MHPNFQVCLLGKHVGKEVLITPETSLLAITEPLGSFWIFMRTALTWNHFSSNYLLWLFGSRSLLHIWALWSAEMKQESKSLKCLWCKFCSTFTTFGKSENPSWTGIFLAGCEEPPELLGSAITSAILRFQWCLIQGALTWSGLLVWVCLAAGSAGSVIVPKALGLLDVFKARRDN